MDKERTFAKIVERTAKLDAYETAYVWGLSEQVDKASLMWFIKQKMDAHQQFVNELPVRYETTSQSLEPK